MGASSICDGMLLGPVLYWSCAHALSSHEVMRVRVLYQIQKAYFCYTFSLFSGSHSLSTSSSATSLQFGGSDAVFLFRTKHPTILSILASYELQSGYSLVPHWKSESRPILQP